MRRLRRRMTAVLTALLLLTLLIPWGLAEPAPGPHQTTVLFTHDLHSHFLPLERADGGESGGYARLASALEQQRALHPDALTLDGGDFSIGSLVQTLYTTRAAELRTMGALGYDATTAGNHEFDHTGLGFARCSRRPTPAEIRFRPCSWPTTPHRPVVLTSWTSSGPCRPTA